MTLLVVWLFQIRPLIRPPVNNRLVIAVNKVNKAADQEVSFDQISGEYNKSNCLLLTFFSAVNHFCLMLIMLLIVVLIALFHSLNSMNEPIPTHFLNASN